MQVAIIGMAGRFPGAPDVDAFWRLLREGRTTVGPVPPGRWDHAAIADPEHDIPAAGCFLDDVDGFDAAFFGISPREAAVLDPQQSLVLEVGWEALEDAGVRAADLRGSRTGVYVGTIWHDHELRRKEHGRPSTPHSIVGNAADVVAGRLSYVLGLTGPSLAVGTGCSSSLVALHLACQALAVGEVDTAFVGGANLMLDPDVTIGLTHFGGLSPTGLCRPFGAGADGFVRGEGAIAVLVKPLDAALRDGDRVRAVILASAVNNDGGGSSLVAPNGAAQEALLRGLYGPAERERLAYVEAHGTGTPRGDAAEAGSLGRALGRAGRLPIGSVKSNVGHLETVAGLAGLVKSVLALEHGVVPRSLHADEPNPDIDLAGLGLEVARAEVPLPDRDDVLVGINSFGWGGTNAHVVLGRAPVAAAAVPADRPGPVVVGISAHTEAALAERVAAVLATVDAGADVHAVAAAMAWHRDHLPEREAVVLDGGSRTPVRGRARPAGRVAFVFPGQGAQWAGMGADLLGSDAAFTASIERCASALRPVVGWDLRELLTGGYGEGWLGEVDHVQPALWAMSVSLAAAWRAAGVRPDVVIGHSQGEIAAATVAGALTVEDAACVVGRRSALLREVAGTGRMLAVDLDRDAALAALEGFEESVSLAVHNGPRSCVLSGEADAVLLLREILEADGVFCRLVKVDYASHSPQVDALLPRVEAALAGVVPRRGRVPLLSTVTTGLLDGPELDAGYWAGNLRSRVRFAEAVDAAVADGVTHLVEISPHPGLTAALGQLAEAHDPAPAVLSTVRRDEGAPADLLHAFGTAWVAGLPALGPRPAQRPRVVLPAYPWQRERFRPADAGRGPGRAGRLEVTPAPAPGGGPWTGSTELSLTAHPWLADHRVGDAVLFPAGGHLALVEGAVGGDLHDVSFPAALPVGDEPVALAVTWRPTGERTGPATVVSRRPGESGWTEHCRVRVAAGAAPAGAPFPEHLLAAPAQDTAQFLRGCAERGLAYGPAFSGVTCLHHSATETLARLDVPRPGGRTAVWDAVLQAALPLAPAGPVVPTALAHAVLGAAPVWVHARRAGDRYDLVVFDADRAEAGRVDGLVLTALPGAAAADERTFRLRFEPAQPPAAGPPVERVVCGPSALNVRRVADVLPGARAVVLGEEPVPACAALVFVAPCGGAEQRAGLPELARLVAHCLEAQPGVSLTVVTGSALPAPDGSSVEPGAGLYAGFATALQSEQPGLQVRLVDIDAVTPAVAAELTTTDTEDVVVLRGEARWVGRRERAGTSAEPRPWRTGGTEQPFRVVSAHPGRLDALGRHPRPRPPLRPGDVEIEVEAVSLNFIDVMQALGIYPDGDGELGLECAGTVVAVGEGVRRVAVGDAVVGCGAGLLGSHAVVDARHVAPIPPGLDPVRACALPIATATAWYALVDVARVRSGETVLVHSAAGGVGLAALGVARLRGATVLATAGTAAKRARVGRLGVEHVLDSRDVDGWTAGVRAATGGRGVDVVLNSLSGAAIPAGLDVLADDGRFVELGKRDIHGGAAVGLDAFRKAVSFTAVDLAGMRLRAPDRFAELLDEVWWQLAAGGLAPLPVQELPFADVERAFRTLAGGEHVGKIVLTGPQDGGPVAPDPTIRPGGTYLVTGGRGALGLSLAEYLVGHGAEAVALVGRSEPGPDVAARVAALRDAGAQVASFVADVADEAELRRVLDAVRAELPPLRGVLHAAGVLDDATVTRITAEQLDRVLRPKFDAAVLLDRLTADDPLDLFVLFSSVAAFVGTAGQAAYAAANAGLDALAACRRRRGRPGLSVQWGSVGGLGLVADQADRLADRGLGSVPVADCWPALWRFLADGESVVCFAEFDPHRWVQTNPAVAAQPSWGPLVTAAPGDPGAGLAEQLRAMPPPARRELVERTVRRDTASVLMVDEAVLERDRDVALASMGLDSLMTIELRNRLESSMGVRLSPTLLWQHGSLARLGAALSALLERR